MVQFSSCHTSDEKFLASNFSRTTVGVNTVTHAVVNDRYTLIEQSLYVLQLGECMALWGEPNELSIQHCVHIFMQYVDSKLAKLRY